MPMLQDMRSAARRVSANRRLRALLVLCRRLLSERGEVNSGAIARVPGTLRYPASRRAARNAATDSSLSCPASTPSASNHRPTWPKSLSMFRTVAGV